jgi:cytochrome c-type biogenesis protein CcmH
MTLWLLMAVMTAIAAAAIVWPLTRPPRNTAAGNDVAVYRDQLDEIDRDRASGAIAAAEAEAARTEVSRRLLAAADAVAADRPPAPPAWQRRAAALVAVVLVPVGALALYLRLGAPDLPSQPLAERLERAHAGGAVQTGAQGQSIDAMIARVEAYLEQHPDDGRGWEVIAPVYMRTGNFDAAVKARANALRLLGATADREADYGETMVAAANGIVTAEARAAFDRAVALDVANVSARFYLGLAAEQDGRKGDAVAAWTQILADAPTDADYADFIRGAIARIKGQPAPGRSARGAGRALTTTDVAKAIGAAPDPQASQADAGQDAGQDEMIHAMVARLAARLKEDGSDVDGWIRLVRSYVVLGDADKARAAIADARAALGKDADKLRRLEAGVKELGVGG